LPEEELALGLVKEHDYAVLDLKKDGSSRLLLIKNPWVDSLVWTGVGSSATLKMHTLGSTSANGSNQFWMAFEDVLQHFDSLYVNWNPALFAHRQDHHFKWEMPDKTEELVFTHNPQYSVLSPSRSPVWVLLSRHWQDGELDILRERRASRDRPDPSLANVSKQLGFMALALYATSPAGTRVPLPDETRRLHQGPYVDSPNTLLRYNPTPGIPQTLVVAQSDLPLPSYTFTLSFFSSEPLTISPAPEPLPYSTTLRSAWTRRTAGGSATHPTYLTNPQWSFTLATPSPISLVLSTDTRDLPVHVAVLFSSPASSTSSTSNGRSAAKRAAYVSGRDVVASSAEYQRGFASAATATARPLDRGTYTVVASTYEPGQTGRFTLRVSAAVTLSLVPVLPDAAGMLRTTVPQTPPPPRRDGSHSHSQSHSHSRRLRARVGLERLTRLSALATTSTTPSTSSVAFASASASPPASAAMVMAVRVALELGTGPHRTVLAVSREGEFADASMGLRTGEVDVEPQFVRERGGLWVVLEQIGGGGGAGSDSRLPLQGQQQQPGVQVEVLSDAVVHLGAWENADED
jgi:hypothetical protein